MATNTDLPIDKLSSWMFAARWGKLHIQQSIKYRESLGMEASSYDVYQLGHLAELEEFLQTNWDDYMNSLSQNHQYAEVGYES